MQAHTLGEVGNLGTVSLRVSFGTILPIFIEIGSYLTDKEQKISWHSFFETRCIGSPGKTFRELRQTYSSFGDGCCLVAGPKLWNSLPAGLRQTDIGYEQIKFG